MQPPAYDDQCPVHGESPRLDVVNAVKQRVAAGEYDLDTFEGDLALNLAADRILGELLS